MIATMGYAFEGKFLIPIKRKDKAYGWTNSDVIWFITNAASNCRCTSFSQ